MILNNYINEIISGDSAIRSVFEWGDRLKKEGKNPINLSIGNPDIKPPEEYYNVLEQVLNESRASLTNPHGYMSNSGYFGTKKRIASNLTNLIGIKFEQEQIFMTAGAANGLDVLLKTLIEPVIYFCNGIPGLRKDVLTNRGSLALDEIITIAPYFVEYGNYIKSNQGKQIVVYSDEKFELDITGIEKEITEKTRAVILNSPNNPTGALYSNDKLMRLAKILEHKNREFGITIAVIEDASYGEILFEGNRLSSILPVYRYSFYVGSFSKSLGLAGERIGYIAVHPEIKDSISEWQILQSALTINLRIRVVNAPALQQRIIEKISPSIKVNVREYEQRVNRLADTLERLGFTFERPKGGFYIFAEIPVIFKCEEDFRKAAQDGDQPLLYIPGRAFGGKKYERYIRLSACVNNEDIERACNKLVKICEKR